MIYYVARERFFNTLAVQLEFLFPELRRHMRLVPYEALHLIERVARGVVIWSDLDRIAGEAADHACALEERWIRDAPDVRQLNSPRRSLRRFDLLRRLHEEEMNRFDVFRVSDRPRRYPVFIREESGYAAHAPRLLETPDALNEAVHALHESGMPTGDLMIVEFGSRPGADGLYRKYGAYRVGDAIFPQHCMMARDWFIKAGDRFPSPAHRREHLCYFHENPHREQLARIFALAEIDYGRIDYTVIDDAIQTFEINTNPSIISNPPKRGAPDQRIYAQAHACALLALDGALLNDAGEPGAAAIAARSDAVLTDISRRRRVRWTAAVRRRLSRS